MKYSVLLFLSLYSFSGIAQEDFRITKISVSEGLSNGRIYDVKQDSIGYLWFATANGITRYSGSSFKKYQLTGKDDFSDPGVLQLLYHNNQLMALMPGGAIYSYDVLADKWVALKTDIGNTLLSMSVYGKDKLVIGTNTGFILFDLKTNQTTERYFPEYLFIRRIIQRNDKLYLSTSKGLKVLKIGDNNTFEEKESYLDGVDILDFEVDNNNSFWIGTEANGLYRLKDDSLTEVPFLEEDNLSVRHIEIDQKGNILLAVDRLGYFILDHFGKLTGRAEYDPDNINSISQNNINTIFIDSDNITWLGVGDVGLNILYKKSQVFKNIKHERFGENTIKNDIVRAIFQDEVGNIWFGTEGGVSKLDTQQNWTNFDKNTELGRSPVLSINSYKGDILFGTYGRGLLKYNQKTGGTKKFSEGISLKRVYTVYPDDVHLWVGGIDGPVHQLLGDSVINKYSTGQVKTFERINEDNLLVGTVEGIYQINTKSGKVTLLDIGEFPITNIYSLEFDGNKDILWVGNDKGLTQLDFTANTSEELQEINEQTGAVYSIIKEKTGALWLASEKGLFNYNTENESYRKYTVSDGQMINEFGFGARSKLLDQRLAFGGPLGAVIFDPKEIEEDISLPKIYISGVEINGTLRDENELFSGEKDHTIELLHNENTIRFAFDYLKIHGSKDYLLKWKLEGEDTNLRSESNLQNIIYRNLDPGTYTLIASVVNADGLPSSNDIKLKIKIGKPIWLMWWAYILYFLIFSAVIYGLYLFNIARQEKKFSDEKIKFFIDVAHDIRTPVSLIRLASNQLLKDDNFQESVNIINRYTRNLNEYVTELLDFQKSERKMLRILASEFNLVEVLNSIIEDFKPMLDEKDISLRKDFPDEQIIWADKVQLSRVFTNLLSNAIKYNHDHGKILIEVIDKEETVLVNIEDTGLGIPKNQVEKIFTRFHRVDNENSDKVRGSGIGLMLSKRIVELHKGTIFCDSEENKGSTFGVELKKGKSHFQASELRKTELKERISKIKASNVEGRRSILVVEDNKDLLAFVKNSLDQDYYVLTAADGKEGLFQIFEHKPDLVITDVMLPGKNGKELCHIIKNDKDIRHTPVLLMTALGGVDDKIAGLEVGADYYLEKPFDIDVLKLAVKNLLKKRSLDAEIANDEIKTAAKTPEESLLSNVIEIVNKNLTNQNFTMDMLCDELGLSRSNLFRKIKSITGLSPSDLIQEIKLNKAKHLLKTDPNIRIDDVAYQSGFNDPKYFSTIFKRHFKTTPSEFHDSQKK